ncbi:hypothetical protein bcgnr5390_51570 [Bacillus luti]
MRYDLFEREDKEYIVQNGLLYRDEAEACNSCEPSNSSCTINLVMLEAEEHMREFLRKKTLAWLDKELDIVLPEKIRVDTREYFKQKNSN